MVKLINAKMEVLVIMTLIIKVILVIVLQAARSVTPEPIAKIFHHVSQQLLVKTEVHVPIPVTSLLTLVLVQKIIPVTIAKLKNHALQILVKTVVLVLTPETSPLTLVLVLLLIQELIVKLSCHAPTDHVSLVHVSIAKISQVLLAIAPKISTDLFVKISNHVPSHHVLTVFVTTVPIFQVLPVTVLELFTMVSFAKTSDHVVKILV
jgi:hypothetical protein